MKNTNKRLSNFKNRKYKDERIYANLKNHQDKHQVEISAARTLKQLYGKFLHCAICEEARTIELCHIIALSNGGDSSPYNLISLCPTHHKLFDDGLLTDEEMLKIEYKIDIAIKYNKLNNPEPK